MAFILWFYCMSVRLYNCMYIHADCVCQCVYECVCSHACIIWSGSWFLLGVFADGIHIRTQFQILIYRGPFIWHKGSAVRLVCCLGGGVAAGGCVWALLQLCVERLDYLVFLLQLLTQPACRHDEIWLVVLLMTTKAIQTIQCLQYAPVNHSTLRKISWQYVTSCNITTTNTRLLSFHIIISTLLFLPFSDCSTIRSTTSAKIIERSFWY